MGYSDECAVMRIAVVRLNHYGFRRGQVFSTFGAPLLMLLLHSLFSGPLGELLLLEASSVRFSASSRVRVLAAS